MPGEIDHTAILIVGYRNPMDIRACLSALGRASADLTFDVFVCENGGVDAYHQLAKALSDADGPCVAARDLSDVELSVPAARLVAITELLLSGRDTRVWVGQACANLGFAGGINVWLERLLVRPGWTGIWVLNPDTEPDPDALQALIERAHLGKKGMVGSTILSYGNRLVHQRGGLSFSVLGRAPRLIGFRDKIDGPHDVGEIEARMDSVGGASMYLTRHCAESIGLMDERFFLYYEDVDWGQRARSHGLGYASSSLVPHKHGSTIGSSALRRGRSRLSVYLQYRNRLQYARVHNAWALPILAVILLVWSAEYLVALAPFNFITAIKGILAGVRGEIGPPPWLDGAKNSSA